MSSICSICQLENPEPSHYWKVHKLKESSYYTKYHPKFDKLTNEPIVFKNREQYLFTDFNDRNNFKRWIKEQDELTKKEYLKNILIKRKELKNLNFVPTQVELRSTDGMAGIKTYNDIFGDYYSLCEEIGLKSRGFTNIDENSILKRQRYLNDNIILVDTREQSYLKFENIKFEIKTLPVGDYLLKNDNYGIVIERKGIEDAISTLSSGYERFKNELIKAKELNLYLILLCESSISDFLNFNYLPWINKKIQATPSFISHRLRELLQEFPNFQVGFCKGRNQMKEIILKIYEMNDFWRFHDIQLAIDLSLFNNEF